MARGDGGLGKADPWPNNDLPGENENTPSPHDPDGYHNRLPGGGHNELPSSIWLDSLVYPERPEHDARGTDMADFRDRQFAVSVGNLTGKKVGPSTD